MTAALQPAEPATDRARRGDLRARRTVLTHMSQDMLEHLDHAERIGVETAHDGMLLELSGGRGPLGC